jgi:hypothetical protein
MGHLSLRGLSAPVLTTPQVQQSLRPSTMKGHSFNNDSSDSASSDGEALLWSLQPSMFRAHTFDDDKPDRFSGVEKESWS